MSDPLSDVVRLLRPHAVFANRISGKGDWAVRYSDYGQPSFFIMLKGRCRLAVDGCAPVTIEAGDFVLLPTTPAFTLSSLATASPTFHDPRHVAGRARELRYGERGTRPDMLSLGGSFDFDCADPGLLVALLPTLVHVHGSERLTQLVRMVGEESAGNAPGNEFILSRLVEILLVEAMRSSAAGSASAGLLRGLGDERLAVALRRIHARIDRPWNVEDLAKASALSRSTFFERFTRVVGVAPMTYVLEWRMAVAKDLLRQGQLAVSEVAERVGYASASAFSVAFRKHAGISPSRY